MATQVQLRRGTNAWHQNFTGAIGETTVNTTDFSLHIHDGVTPGGHKLQTLHDGVASFKDRTGVIVPQAGDYSASQVSVAPAGDLKATDVQAALLELDGKDSAVQKQVTAVEGKANSAAEKLKALEALAKKLSESQEAGVASFKNRTGTVAPQADDYSAAQVSVAPTGGLKATDVQAALVELDAKDSALQRQVTAVEGKNNDAVEKLKGLDTLEKKLTEVQNKAGVVAFHGRTGAVVSQTGDYSASQVSVAPTGGLAATDVQAALLELDGEAAALSTKVTTVDGKVTALAGQVADAATKAGVASFKGRTGAVAPQAGDYSANQVSVTPTGGLAATDVQAALLELDGEAAALSTKVTTVDGKVTALAGQVADAATKAGVASFKGRTGAVAPQAGDYSANQVKVTPVGDLNATDVQAALMELDAKDSVVVNAVTAVQKKVTAVEGKANDTADGLDTLNRKVTNLSGQITEVQNKAGVASFKGRAGVVAPQAGDYSAAQINVAPAGSLRATDVQVALVELDAKDSALQRQVTAVEGKNNDAIEKLKGLDTLEKKLTEVQNKPGVVAFHGRTGAVVSQTGDYNANQVKVTPAGALKSADVQAALVELDARVAQAGGVTSFRGRTGAVTPYQYDYSANWIGFTPTGGLKSYDVQSALEELDTRAASLLRAENIYTASPIGPTPTAGQRDSRIPATNVFTALGSLHGMKISSPEYLEERQALEVDFLPFQSATDGISKVSVKNLFSKRMIRGYSEEVEVVKEVSGECSINSAEKAGNVKYLILDGDANVRLPSQSNMNHATTYGKTGTALSLTIVIRQNKIGGHAVVFYDFHGQDTLLWDANGIQPSIATGPNQETMFSFFLLGLDTGIASPRWKAVRVHKGG